MGYSNFNGFCNVIRVKNIQQVEKFVSGEKYQKYECASELFCVFTDDRKFQRLYTYNETEKILNDLLESGYISYADFYKPLDKEFHGLKKGQENYKKLRIELKEFLVNVANEEYRGVTYCREELSQFCGKLCIVHGGQMHCDGKDLPAFRYKNSSLDGIMSSIEKSFGNVESFKNDLNRFINDYPLVQLIFAYYLSGAIRQILAEVSEGLGEYGLVVCITGEPGCGKTLVTTTLQKVLFGDAKQLSNNLTSIGLYKVIRNSGICPVVLDDSSTNTSHAISNLKDKVSDIYNIASGRCRITNNSKVNVPVFAPYIESREDTWSLTDMVRPIREIEGYRYRMLELYCHQGDLTKNAEEARQFGQLSGRYKGMATIFLDYLVDKYNVQQIMEIYNKHVNELDKMLASNNLEARYSNRAAVIIVTAKICAEAYGISMDITTMNQIMIDAFKALENRLVSSEDNPELKRLYNFFTEKNEFNEYRYDDMIAFGRNNFRHKKHYACIMENKKDEFYIPKDIIWALIGDSFINPPGFWGYDGKNKIDIPKPDSVRWKHILENWMSLGILIGRSGESGYSKNTVLNKISTNCYHFSWTALAKQFGDNTKLDTLRFVRDLGEDILDEEGDLFDKF